MVRDRKRPAHERVVLVGRVLGDERAELGTEHREDLANLGCAHPGLVVLEEHVVRVVVRCEALDVLPAQIHDALERRPERCEVRLLARLDPHLVRLGGCLGELDRELGGHAARTVPVALGDPDQGGVVGIVRKRARVRLELLEQLAEPLVDDVRVDDLLERPELRRSGRGAAGRHEHRHVPEQDCFGAAQVGELAQAFLELGEGLLHGG